MRYLALLLCLMLLPTAALAEEPVLINRLADPSLASPFAEDAQLLEIFFPKITGVDAAFMRYGEYSVLIDCGGEQWREVEKLLNKLGVTEITYALNSHPDADHIGGYHRVLPNFPAKEFIYGFPEDYPDTDDICHKVYAYLHEANVPMRRAENGGTLDFGGASLTMYQLEDDSIARVNNRSVVLMAKLGDRSIFFAGDLQKLGQNAFAALRDTVDLDADILKYPHHGYDKMQEDFLDAVSPRFIVVPRDMIESGTKKQLRERGIDYYVTYKGMLRLATDGEVWLIEPFK